MWWSCPAVSDEISGPRCGLGDSNSWERTRKFQCMPGVNPTQTESATMVAVRVMGNDTVVGMAASQEWLWAQHSCRVLIDAFIESANLLADSLISLEKCVEASQWILKDGLPFAYGSCTLNHISVMRMLLAFAKKAHADNSTLCEAGTSLGLFTAEEYGAWIDLMAMTGVEK